jgi:hypothetical protein
MLNVDVSYYKDHRYFVDNNADNNFYISQSISRRTFVDCMMWFFENNIRQYNIKNKSTSIIFYNPVSGDVENPIYIRKVIFDCYKGIGCEGNKIIISAILILENSEKLKVKHSINEDIFWNFNISLDDVLKFNCKNLVNTLFNKLTRNINQTLIDLIEQVERE